MSPVRSFLRCVRFIHLSQPDTPCATHGNHYTLQRVARTLHQQATLQRHGSCKRLFSASQCLHLPRCKRKRKANYTHTRSYHHDYARYVFLPTLVLFPSSSIPPINNHPRRVGKTCNVSITIKLRLM
uniref:Uncharacterized protein n=1 Tax=Anopheles quadriannulatus TaxID=34691 RepID=A0A182XQ74_ANOQN